MIPTEKAAKDGYLLVVSKKGYIKRTEMSEYETQRKNAGIVAAKLDDGDSVAYAMLTSGDQDVFIVTKKGQCVRYPESLISIQGRNTRGCRAMVLHPEDEIAEIFMLNTDAQPDIFVLTSGGYGKRTSASEYRALGSRMVKGYSVIDKRKMEGRGDCVAGACSIYPDDTLLALTKLGQSIRFSSEDVKNTSRATSGVKVMNINTGDEVIGLVKICPDEEETV
jgi:DNA gyrase subunit A